MLMPIFGTAVVFIAEPCRVQPASTHLQGSELCQVAEISSPAHVSAFGKDTGPLSTAHPPGPDRSLPLAGKPWRLRLHGP